jgi:hypothetical protein
MPFPCRSPTALIHTCHASTLPFSDSAVSFVKIRVVDGNIRTARLLLLTTFVELRVVAGRSRTRPGRPHSVSGRQLLIHTYHCRSHSALMPHCAVALRSRFHYGMAGERRDMCESNTAALLNQMGKIQSKPIGERHGRGTAWERHGMCESNTAALCKPNGKDTI